MTASEAKIIPLQDVLTTLGHQPKSVRKGGEDLWYLSPFRMETKPSFHLNLPKNVWFDFGLGAGGDVAEFAKHYFKCRLPEALAKLDKLFPKIQDLGQETPEIRAEKFSQNTDKEAFKLLFAQPLANPNLIKYLTHERFVRLKTARLFLQEIHFENTSTGKKYFAAGLPNLAGGWEIRNPHFKSSIGGKAMTHLPGGSPTLSVFEGMLDFLSAFDFYGPTLTEGHVLVLHSVSFLEKAIEFAETGAFSRIYTYFDNDGAGEAADRVFREKFAGRVEPCHGLYFPCKDFNEWMVRRSR